MELRSILSSDEMLSETNLNGPLNNLFKSVEREHAISNENINKMLDELLYVALAPKTSREEKLKMIVECAVAIKVYIATQDPKVVDLIDRS